MNPAISDRRAQRELKIVVSGPMGAGKTTLIGNLSESEVVSTEAHNSEDTPNKPLTTVAMDYGRRQIDEDTVVAFYGTPGQERFDFMWSILANNAFGVVALAAVGRPHVEQDIEDFLKVYNDLLGDIPTVIGLTHVDREPAAFEGLSAKIASRHPDIPVLPIDPRQTDSAELVIETLIALASTFGSHALDNVLHADDIEFELE